MPPHLHPKLGIYTHCKSLLKGKPSLAAKPPEVQPRPLKAIPTTATARKVTLNINTSLQPEIQTFFHLICLHFLWFSFVRVFFKLLNFKYLFIFVHLFTCAYIVWVISPPCHPSPPFPYPPTSLPGKVLFCPYLKFC
jgi:hypothetical protein